MPGVHNAYRPHFFRTRSIAALGGIVVLLFFIALAMERLVVRSPSPQVGAVVSAVLVDLTNADRAANGLVHLSTSTVLQKAAQMKADDMASKGYFAHNTPEGLTPWHFFKEAGYRFRFAGENLAVYFSDSVEVERAWMNSPTHRANILNQNFTEIGIALAHGRYQGHDTVYVVQMFGKPARTAARITSYADGESQGPVAGASAEAQPVTTLVEDGTFIAVRASEDDTLADVRSAPPVGAITNPPQTSAFWRVVTAPKTLLQYIYMVMAAVIIIALVMLVAIEIRRQSPLHIAYGVAVLVLMSTLAFAGFSFFSGSLLIV